VDLITGKPQQGASVQLTINSKAQQAAYAALKASGKSGAVVALNPKTGAILALASYPSFDPNGYATFDGAKLNKIDARYRNNQNQPLLNRAINASYPPGSTFKIVTSSAALGTGRYNANSSVYAPTVLKLPQTSNTLINSNGEVCGSLLKQQADKFGFNNASLTIPMPVSPSNYVAPPSQALTAYSAIGQYSDTVTPMQEAMLSAAIANGGRLMKPYLVQDVKAPDLTTVQQATPSLFSQPVSATTASQVKAMMVSVVNATNGTAVAVPGIHGTGLNIAGKTGTAQNGTNNTGLNDAVFTALAPAPNPDIAIGVVIRGGGYGAAAAAPIAVQVISAYLHYLGHP
jgi:peptidoglycan glycosyltransferase